MHNLLPGQEPRPAHARIIHIRHRHGRVALYARTVWHAPRAMSPALRGQAVQPCLPLLVLRAGMAAAQQATRAEHVTEPALGWQASAWEQRAQESDAQRDSRSAESAAAVQSARSEVQTLQQRLDDAGSAAEQASTTHQAELATEIKRRKELGDKVRLAWQLLAP